MNDVSNIPPGILAVLREYFSKQPVLKAWVFGSVSRGEATSKSDIDIIVCFDPEAQVGIFQHIAMSQELEYLLKKEVDLVTDGTLLPLIKEAADKDKILIYEREIA